MGKKLIIRHNFYKATKKGIFKIDNYSVFIMETKNGYNIIDPRNGLIANIPTQFNVLDKQYQKVTKIPARTYFAAKLKVLDFIEEKYPKSYTVEILNTDINLL